MLDNFKPYSSDPFTDNYGAINIFNVTSEKWSKISKIQK